MKGFEAHTPANDNNDIYEKLEIISAEWLAQCEEVSSIAQELSELVSRAKLETSAKGQVTCTIGMIELAMALQEVLSLPRQHVTLTEQAD